SRRSCDMGSMASWCHPMTHEALPRLWNGSSVMGRYGRASRRPAAVALANPSPPHALPPTIVGCSPRCSKLDRNPATALTQTMARTEGRPRSAPVPNSPPVATRRVFVTGGAGYIGSVLSQQLLEHGHQVTVFDRLFFG